MTTLRDDSEQRVAIWSIAPQAIGAYFAIFLAQYIPLVAMEAYARIQQAQGDSFSEIARDIVRASGPLGGGAAMNALAVALCVEAIMVLASWLRKQQLEEGIKIGRTEGVEIGVQKERERANIERKRSNAKLRAWAKENGVPIENLPIDIGDEDDG